MNDLVLMTHEEARDKTDKIKNNISDTRYLLLEIQDREGWKALGYDSWRAYGQDEFGYSQSRIYQLVEAAKVEKNISTIVEKGTPIQEGQLRPLTKLATAEAQREAWETVVETAPEGKITAYHVSKVVNGKLKIHIIDNVNKMKHEIKKIRKEHIVNEEVRKAYDAFYWQVQNAKLEKWAHTSKQACLQMVEWINDLIEI